MTIVEEWHDLRQTFNPSNPITINQMHIFKDQLKQVQQTEETLRILVEVYCLLRMYPEAYRLFTVIMNKDDKKDRKKYGVLQTKRINKKNYKKKNKKKNKKDFQKEIKNNGKKIIKKKIKEGKN